VGTTNGMSSGTAEKNSPNASNTAPRQSRRLAASPSESTGPPAVASVTLSAVDPRVR